MDDTRELLLQVPSFADLPGDQVDWFLSQSQELRLHAGETYARQGDPAEFMFVLLQGDFQWRGEISGESVVLTISGGEISGILPFSRMKTYSLTGRTLTEARLLKFPAAQFPQLVQKMPELATRLVGKMSDRIREVTRLEQQRDRLVALGKLSAGLAHELNNPAAAALRAATSLRETLETVRDASLRLVRHPLSAEQRDFIFHFERQASEADRLQAEAQLAAI